MATAHPNRNLISSEDVHGTDVYGVGDQAVGEIDHLLIEKVSGRVAYAVMSFGGFLATRSQPLPNSLVGASYDAILAATGRGLQVSQLRDAPAFSDNSWTDRAWETQTHEHYKAKPYWS